jgi:uncharacterized RDD family membrane protein YckC
MKTFSRLPLRPFFAAASLLFSLTLRAQEAPSSTATPPATTSERATSTAAPTPAADSSAAPTPAAAEAAPADKATVPASGTEKSGETKTPPPSPEPVAVVSHDEVPFGDHTVPAGTTSEEAVSVFGSTIVDGEVTREAVAVFGDTVVNGRAGREAVAVFGNVQVNGRVGREVVAVFGNVDLGPDAVVDGKIVSVFGSVNRAPSAVVHGRITQVMSFAHLPGTRSLKIWVQKCLMTGRPLGFGPGLAPAWMFAGAVLLFYVIIALLFRGGVEKCVVTLEQRPGMSVLTAFLAVLLTPLILVLVTITGIGVVLVPAVLAVLFFASLFGRAVVHAWIGRLVTRSFAKGALAHVASSVIFGGLLISLVYCVPFLGFVVWKLLGTLGFGVVVCTVALGAKKERTAASTAASSSGSPSAASAIPAMIGGSALVGAPAGGAAHGSPSATAVMGMLRVTQPHATGSAPTAAASMRAGFWSRMLALFIDAFLIGLLFKLTSHVLPPIVRAQIGMGGYLIVLAAYGAVLWKLRGATIGDIICGLKVVRVDDRPLDWTTAVVRALGCFLSLVVAGLGFIWAIFDQDAQCWHDKIAGTVVVRAPKGSSLV